jgi:hypothetical protein
MKASTTAMVASRGPGLSGVVTAVIGLAAGALGSAMFSYFRDSNAEVKAPPILRAPAGSEAAMALREMRTMLELERRRQATPQAEVKVESAIAPAEAEPASEEELQLSLEEEAAAHARAHEGEIREHAREPRDGAWAADAEAGIRSSLESLPALGGRVLRVDCRTTTCTSEVEWSHYGAALGGYAAGLHAVLPVKCGKSIVLPKPLDESAAYRGTFVFDCETSRLED